MTSGKFINIWKQKLPLYLKMRRTLADDTSLMALNEFKDNFRKQGYMNVGSVFIPWKATKSGKKSRVFGKNSNGRILMGKPPRLKASLHKKPTYDTARVVTDKPYAKIHNEGGVIHRIYVRHTKKKGQIITQEHSTNINMPKRTFMNAEYVNKSCDLLSIPMYRESLIKFFQSCHAARISCYCCDLLSNFYL